MLKSNLIQISLVRHVFSNIHDMIVHSDIIIIVMLEITAVQGQIKIAWGPWQELRNGPMSNEEEDEKQIYFWTWGN